ncbi:TPA: hypothetical protein EYP66_00250 [Candidatus Poribacteria bacterium]|nr:hypothetical protein [Candidatus Poribacteria bacterium]
MKTLSAESMKPKRIYALAYRYTHDSEGSLDLTQEIFLRVYTGIANFRLRWNAASFCSDLLFLNSARKVGQPLMNIQLRSYAFLYAKGENISIYTWKDNDFDEDWSYDPGTPIRIADVGKWRFIDDQHFTDGNPAPTPPDVSANGAGLWEVRIGEAVHRCLRVLEPDKSTEGAMVETFVDCHGRTMLARRYNGSRSALCSGTSRFPILL